jgi:hypothetical protein
MRTHSLRRAMVVVLIGCVLVGGCTRSTLRDQVGPPSGGASSSTSVAPPGTGGSSTTGGSTPSSGPSTSAPATSAPAANVATLDRDQPGSVQLPDGARVAVPADAVTSPTATLRLDADGVGGYVVAVEGTVEGATEVRIPAGSTDPATQSFMLVKTADGWIVPPAERRADGFLYAALGVPVTVRAVTCGAKPPSPVPQVLACLTDAGVTQLSKPVADAMAAGLTCGAPWPSTNLLRREDYCITAPTIPNVTTTTQPAQATPPTVAPGGNGGGAPGPTPTTRPEPLRVSLSENPVLCTGQRRPFGVIANAFPGEQVEFTSPTISMFLPGTADGSGQLTIYWRCDATNASNVWSLTATGQSSGRTVTFTFGGTAG